MIGFEGRHQWRRHKLFKLRAKLPQCEKYIFYKRLGVRLRGRRDPRPHPKFAIRLFLVRRTTNKQAA
jgi:hypothetical protein